jgi:hypothetical protein
LEDLTDANVNPLAPMFVLNRSAPSRRRRNRAKFDPPLKTHRPAPHRVEPYAPRGLNAPLPSPRVIATVPPVMLIPDPLLVA